MKNKFILPYIFLLQCLILGTNTAQTSTGFDYKILKNLNNNQSPADNNFQKFVSKTAPFITGGVPIIMIGAGLIGENKDLTRKGVETGIALALTFGETYVIKHIVKRPRPYVTHQDLHNLSTEKTFSFPSGHSSGAFSVATSLSLNYPKWYVIAPAYIFAGATGFSRMYLNVHYPTDVLAGAVLGSATAWATWKINKKLRK